MAMIQAGIVGDVIAFRFSTFCEGLREWADEESGATWQPTFAAWKPGSWAYTMPASKDNAARLLLTAPMPVDCSPELKSLVGTIDEGDFFAASSAVEEGEQLTQPAVRVMDKWNHQLRGYHFARRRKWRAGLAMGMGTGKSAVAIDILVNALARRCLILCPASVLGVWRGQFRQHGPQCNVCILDDSMTVAKKRSYATSFLEASRFTSAAVPFVVVVNYESAIRSEFSGWATLQQWDATILDEAHRAKNPDGATGKLVGRLRLRSTIRLALSGTFMPHSPADLFSPFRFVDPSIFGDNYFQFKKRYAITGTFGEFLGWRRKLELRKRYHTGAIVIGSEVLDLPAVQHIEITFDLPKKSQAIYQELWEEFCTVTAGGIVTVDNALVKLLRAQQITSGYLPLDEAIGEELDPTAAPRPKIEILNDSKEQLLADRLRDIPDDDPVCVFCKYRYDLETVRRVVERLEWERNGVKQGNEAKRDEMIARGEWRPFRCGEVSGTRKDLTSESKLPPGFAVFAVQEQSGGVGVDFTRSCIGILYSIGFSLGNYDQILARLNRPGQTRPVRFYHLIANRTVDRQIRRALNNRRRVVDSISAAIDAGTLRSWTEEEAA